MDWKSCVRNDENMIDVPNNWLCLHYYEALSVLFRFENALRIFVYTVLKNVFHDKWMDASFSDSNTENQSVQSIYKKRKSQAEKFGYLGYHVECPIMHLTSGELISIILSDAYWGKSFKNYFQGSKESIRIKMSEVVSIRNSLAHFRPIKSEDVEYIKQNINHTTLEIEQRLGELFEINTPVPTNTDYEWYKMLKNLGFSECSVQLYQSKNEHWIKIVLIYITDSLSLSAYTSTYKSARVLNLQSQNALIGHDSILKYVTCVMEGRPYGWYKEDIVETHKELSFVFDKRILDEHCGEVVDEFISIINTIEKETELVKDDNLAKGNLVESVSCGIKKSRR
ncbi:Swt1 family HEPN domain-containing protein [Desulfovibrio caledoniensis]